MTMPRKRILLPLTSFLALSVAESTLATEPVIVTAPRGTSIESPPVNTTIYTAEAIRRSGASDLSEFFAKQSGIRMQDLFGIGGVRSSIDLGAFGTTGNLNTLILLNGRRLNDVDLEGANLATIPLIEIERIEVMHGAATVLYGDNATAGAINIVTRSGATPDSTRIALEGGSFDTVRVSAAGGTQKNGTELFVSLDGFTSNGYRDHNEVDNHAVLIDASSLWHGASWGARVGGSREDTQLPGALSAVDFQNEPTKSNLPLQSGNQHQWNADLYALGERCAGELSFRRKHQRGEFYGVTTGDLDTLSLTPRCTTTIDMHRITAGIDAYRSNLDARGEFDGFTGPVANDSDTTRRSIGVYINDSMNVFTHTNVVLGARYQQVDQDITNTDIDGVSSNDRADDEVSAFDLTLTQQFAPELRGYLRWASSFRSPVLDEMWSYFDGTITPLQTQTGRHVELGATLDVARDAQLKFQAGRALIDDEIGFDAVLYKNVNLDPTIHQTLDLTLSTQALQWWNLSVGFAYRDAEFRSGTNEGKRLPEIPRRKWTLINDFQMTARQFLVIDITYNADTVFGNDYSNVAKPFPNSTITNAAYRYVAAEFSVRVKVNNVTNDDIATSGYYFDSGLGEDYDYSYYPLPERAYYVMLEKPF